MEKPTRNLEREAMVMAALNDSPFYRHVGMRIREFTDCGSIMEMAIIPQHMNIWAIAHGGVVSSLVDSSCGTAMVPILSEGQGAVTLDLRVQFLRPVREGTLTSLSRVVHQSRRFIISETEVFDKDNNLVARGNTIHALVPRAETSPGSL